MKLRTLIPISSVFLLCIAASSCSLVFKHQQKVAAEASENFLLQFRESRFSDIYGSLTDFKGREKVKTRMIDNLTLIKNSLGEIKNATLIKSSVRWDDDYRPYFSEVYRIDAENGSVHQQLDWYVINDQPKLAYVMTYGLDEKGEMQLLVIDGKIIF